MSSMSLSPKPFSPIPKRICDISKTCCRSKAQLKFQTVRILKNQWVKNKTNGVVHAYTLDFQLSNGMVSGPIQEA